MEDLFYRRMAVEHQKVVVLAAAMMTAENQDSVIKAVRRLGTLMFPRDEEAEAAREEAMKQTLRAESTKSYKVHKLFFGDRGG